MAGGAECFCAWVSLLEATVNNNTIGLLYQFIAKETDFAQVTDPEVEAQRLLNNRPRKGLGHRIPDEVF
jgi:IS30 family transposase